mgnify:CR=1 FL=1
MSTFEIIESVIWIGIALLYIGVVVWVTTNDPLEVFKKNKK